MTFKDFPPQNHWVNFIVSLLFIIEKIVTLHLSKLESLSLKEALCQVWFIDCLMFFAVSAIYRY